MEWTFWPALVIVIIVVVSLLLWRPGEKDDVDDALERFKRWQIFRKGRKP